MVRIGWEPGGSSAIRHPLAPISMQRRAHPPNRGRSRRPARRGLRTIELGLCLKPIEGCVQRGRARRIPGALVVLLAQPGLKALASKRPGFPVAVDDEIGKAGAVACLKELGGHCDIEEDVRAAHCARPSSALLTAFHRRPLCLGQPDRTAIPSWRQESPGAPRDPSGDALADHRAGFVARADGRP